MKVKIILDGGREVEAEISQEQIDEICDNNGMPKKGQEFWYIDPYFGVADATWDGSYIDTCYYECGNYFKTEQEAIDRVAYMKAENTLRRAIAKANDGWVYKAGDEVSSYVCVGINDGIVLHIDNYMFNIPIWYYIKSRELAAQLMEEYEKEFRIYLGA